MRKSDRLFQLTNILRKHQPITAKHLAEKLKVSERTVYRYVDDLSVAGIPIYGEPGVGYRLSEGFELPPLQLTQGELEALITGVSLTAALTGKEVGASAHSLLAKIEAALPGGVENTSDSESVVRVPAYYHRTEVYPRWSAVHSAIRDKRWLKVKYRALSDNVTTRTVFPLGLFYWGGKWTLGCWCELRADYRQLRLDLIQHLELTEPTGALPDSVSLAAYIEQKNINTN